MSDEETQEKQVCPFCNKGYTDLGRHYKSSKKCGEQYRKKDGDESPDEDAEIMDAVLANANERDNAPVPAPEPAPARRQHRVKFVDELPLSDISGITAPMEEKLKAWFKDHGIVAIQQLANMKIADINMKGIGEAKASAILTMTRNMLGIHFMTPASEIPVDYQITKLGVPALDAIFGGGLRTGETYEFFGPYGCGKTQVALYAAICSMLPVDKYGLYDPVEPDVRPQVIWMDSEGTFDGIVKEDPATHTSRLKDVTIAIYKKNYPEPASDAPEEEKSAYTRNLNDFINMVATNIIVCKVTSAEHQMETVKYILERISEFNVRMVVVDSIITHFRSEFIGRGTLSDRQQKLNQHIHDLHILRGNDATLICTNQVQATPDGMSYGGADFAFKATGGNVLAHALNIRVKFRKGAQKSIHAEIVDASYLPPKDANFLITSTGIEPIDE